MIRKQKDITIVQLGNDNTNISCIIKKGEKSARGLVFSNDSKNVLDDNSVIIEILNKRGMEGYAISLIEFLKTHSNNNEKLDVIKNMLLDEIENIE